VKRLGKQSTSLLADSPIFGWFVSTLERKDGARPDLLRVLTYHRVAEPETYPFLDSNLISATPLAFERQMAFLAANYQILSAADLLEVSQLRRPLPPNAVMVTFDDAYCDFADHAWPVLKRLKIPVILFVPTAFPGHPERVFWWDKLYYVIKQASSDELSLPIGKFPLVTSSHRKETLRTINGYIKSLKHLEAMRIIDEICEQLNASSIENCVMDWDMLRQLASEGVILGAHTRTHPLMNQISIEDARDEVLGSIRDLGREIGPVLPIFAYPGGGFNEEIVKILKLAGIRIAFTTVRGINKMGEVDLLQLRRINVGSRTTLQLLRAQLLPLAVHLNPWWSL
jgi:peptidoglycan/xylan/chitin deacetylase (PgdA/CDA1 family)